MSIGRALVRAVRRVGRTTAGVVVLLVTAGCAVGERPMLTDEAIGVGSLPDGGAAANTLVDGVDSGDSGDDGSGELSTTGGTVESASTDDGGALDDPADLGDAPAVVMTATGIPVAVLGRAEHGFVVNTPCGNEGEILWGQPVGPVDVVLDPGHGGGDDEGALGPNGATEAEVNLDIARRAAARLEREGYTVALTRTADYRITIANRAAIADRLEAQAFVSIHHNSPTPSSANGDGGPGTEVYPQVGSDEANRLGGLLYDEVVAALSEFDVAWAAASNAGVLQVINSDGESAYGIVRRPSVPSALVELAYLSNPSEAVVIGTTDYRNTAAAAITRGVVRYLGTGDEGSGYVEEPRLTDPSAETGGSDGCVDPPLE